MQNTHMAEHTDLKNNPFRVPHGYFESLPQLIEQKRVRASTPSIRVISSRLAYAASFVLLIGLGYGLMRLIVPGLSDNDLPDTENLSLFKTYTLLQHDEQEDSFDSEQIITFLTEHGISPNAVAVLD